MWSRTIPSVRICIISCTPIRLVLFPNAMTSPAFRNPNSRVSTFHAFRSQIVIRFLRQKANLAPSLPLQVNYQCIYEICGRLFNFSSGTQNRYKISLSSGVCYMVIFNSSILRNCWGLVVLSGESLLVTTPGINWYWLESGLVSSSQNGLRPLNPFFNCSKHRWSMGRRPLLLEIRSCIFSLCFEVLCCKIQRQAAATLLTAKTRSFLLPTSQSRPALFCRVDSVNSILATCHCWSHPHIVLIVLIVLIVPAYWYVVFCLSYHPAPYTEVAGSRLGGQRSAWVSKPSNFPNRFMASCVVLMLPLIKDLWRAIW